MKVKIVTLMLCALFSVPMMAQRKSDAFFYYQNTGSRAIITTPVEYQISEAMEFERMNIAPVPVPIKNGVLSFAIFSSMYLVFRRKEDLK